MAKTADEVLAEKIDKLVKEKIDKAVQDAVTKTAKEVEERVKNNYETAMEHFHMNMADPTKADGAIYQMDNGKGYVFGMIEIENVDYNPISNRTEEELAPDAPDLQPLKDDIVARGGVVRPILVYRDKKNEGRYILIKGARRIAALKALDEELVQAYIMPAKPPPGLEDDWVNGL